MYAMMRREMTWSLGAGSEASKSEVK